MQYGLVLVIPESLMCSRWPCMEVPLWVKRLLCPPWPVTLAVEDL